MTTLLEEAFTQATKLPEWEQDAIAAFILEEIAISRSWQEPSRSERLRKLIDVRRIIRGQTSSYTNTQNRLG